MTAYCTMQQIEDVGTQMGRPFNATQEPTKSRVERFAYSVYVRINAALSARGISVPVTQAASPNAYDILADLNALGAGLRTIKFSYRMSQPNEAKWIKDAEKEYKDLWDTYMDNPKALVDAEGMISPGYCSNKTISTRPDLDSDYYDVFRPSHAI